MALYTKSGFIVDCDREPRKVPPVLSADKAADYFVRMVAPDDIPMDPNRTEPLFDPVSRHEMRVHLPGRARLVLRDGRSVHYAADVPGGEDIAFQTAVHHVSSVLMFQRKGLFLHGSAVHFRQGGAAIFMAPAGTGKSTLAAALVGRGNALISDDMVALDGFGPHPRVLPVEIKSRLHDDSIQKLGLADRSRKSRNFSKSYVAQTVWTDKPPPPVKAVFFLKRSGQGKARMEILDNADIESHIRIHILNAYYMRFFGGSDYIQEVTRSWEGLIKVYSLDLGGDWQGYEEILDQITNSVSPG